MANTIRDRIVAALIARGERLVTDARTSRYVVVTRQGDKGENRYVGKSGALRVGRTVADSRPVSAAFKAALLGEMQRRP